MADERVNNGEELELEEELEVNEETDAEAAAVAEDIDDFDGDDFSEPEEIAEDEADEADEDDEKAQKKTEKRERGLKRKAKAKKLLNKLVKPMIAAGSVILGAFIVLYICCIVTLPQDTVANNVLVEGIDVSGLSYDDALAAVEATYLLESQNITIECEGQQMVLDGKEIGLSATPEATAQKAFNYGKSGNILKDGFTAVRLIFAKKHIVPVATMNHDIINQKLGEFGTAVRGELKQVSVEITDAGAVITPGVSGFDHNTDTAREQILDAVANDRFENIHVTLNSVAPEKPTVEYIGNAIYCDPIDAYYHISGKDIMVIAEVPGRYYNAEEIEPVIEQIYEGGPQITVPYYPSYAQVGAQELQEKLFSSILGSYSTYFAAGGNRGKNVARAASLINGTILASGEEFSFNNTVGRRTTENGFFSAPEYVAGQSVQGIGGGTCQVSTTLYSAVLYADMGITDRTEHMMTVGYAPLGQDATVADGSLDFKFRNTSDYPVKIVAGTDGSKLTVSVVGTQWDPPREVKLTHSKSMSGDKTVVVSKRLVYANGELISTDPLDTSVYSPHPTAVPETAPSTSSSASTSSATSASSEATSSASESASSSGSGSASSASSATEADIE